MYVLGGRNIVDCLPVFLPLLSALVGNVICLKRLDIHGGGQTDEIQIN